MLSVVKSREDTVEGVSVEMIKLLFQGSKEALIAMASEMDKLSEDKENLINRVAELTQENEEALKSNAELMAASRISAQDQELLRELQAAYVLLQEERDVAVGKLNLLEEWITTSTELLQANEELAREKTSLVQVNAELHRSNEYLVGKVKEWSGKSECLAGEKNLLIQEKTALAKELDSIREKAGTNDELKKSIDLLTAEIQSLAGGKENLISEIEILKKEKGFVDLHDWIRRTMRLGELAENKSTSESRQEAREILRNTPDLLVRYNPISNLYEYAVGNGSE